MTEPQCDRPQRGRTLSSGQRVSERAPDIALGLELASWLSAVVADAPAYPSARLVEALARSRGPTAFGRDERP
jgi:hypothetical protein